MLILETPGILATLYLLSKKKALVHFQSCARSLSPCTQSLTLHTGEWSLLWAVNAATGASNLGITPSLGDPLPLVPSMAHSALLLLCLQSREGSRIMAVI